MEAPLTSGLKSQSGLSPTVDIYASHAPHLVVKRAPEHFHLESTRVLYDLQQLLSSHLERPVTILSSVETGKDHSRIADLSEASVFLALAEDAYFESKICREELERASRLESAYGKPRVFALDLRAPNEQSSKAWATLSKMIPDAFRLGSSKANASARELEAEYQEKLEVAAKLIADMLGNVSPYREDAPKGRDEVAASQAMRPIWLCRYSLDASPEMEDRIKEGRFLFWPFNPASPKDLSGEIEVGDHVAVWRTEANSELGELVAWAKIAAPPNANSGQVQLFVGQRKSKGAYHAGRLGEILESDTLDVHGAPTLLKLDATAQSSFLSHLPTNFEKIAIPVLESETHLSSDRPETIHDLLRRGPLAFALAHKINDIWTAQEPKSSDPRAHERGAFILHIDAPWGGGKTTFANFVSRFLNYQAHGLEPSKYRDQPDTIFFDIDMGDDRKKNEATPDNSDWPEEFRERKWIAVPFNAWRHQHVSPPWWDLYEVIRKHVLQALPFWKRPSFILGELAWRIFSKQVWWTLVGLAFVAAGVWGLMQFPLVANWFTKDDSVPPIVTAITGTTGLVALIQASRTGFQKLVSSAGNSTDSVTLGTSDPLRRFRAHFAQMLAFTNEPVLVVIDDLDRCEPKYITELVRGMMTVFQSPYLVFLLLGDKGWIETAFAKVHQDMRDAHDEEDVGFGARFVEKAIQMSFVLPEANAAERDQYVKRLLQPRPRSPQGKAEPVADEPLREAMDEARRIESKATAANTPEQRRRIVDDAVKDFDKERQQAIVDLYNRREAVKTAAKQTAEKEIRHALEPLKSLLPLNPRRIKRIINMITVYQASGQATMGIDPGTEEWRQLVVWVVLMAEYPAHWRLLCTNPDLLERINCLPSGCADESLAAEDKILAKFRDQRLSALILGKPYREALAEAVEEDVDTDQLCALSKEMVERLKRLIPVH